MFSRNLRPRSKPEPSRNRAVRVVVPAGPKQRLKQERRGPRRPKPARAGRQRFEVWLRLLFRLAPQLEAPFAPQPAPELGQPTAPEADLLFGSWLLSRV